MDRATISKLCKQVEQKFPEIRGVSPSIKRDSSSSNGIARYSLIFKGYVALPGGKKITRIVRVIADEDGRILRMSTSK